PASTEGGTPQKLGRYFVDSKAVGGRGRDRTGDPLLAKQVLSQLSYTPTVGVPFIIKHLLRCQNPFPPHFRCHCTRTVPKPPSPGTSCACPTIISLTT